MVSELQAISSGIYNHVVSGPLNKIAKAIMDFIGTTQQSLDRGIYRYYLLGTMIFLLIAVIGRV